jgi:hypothetical protein
MIKLYSNEVDVTKKALADVKSYLGIKAYNNLSQQMSTVMNKQAGYFILTFAGIEDPHATIFLKRFSGISDWDDYAPTKQGDPSKVHPRVIDFQNEEPSFSINLQCGRYCSHFETCIKTCSGVKCILR